jgi:hypothetical protein
MNDTIVNYGFKIDTVLKKVVAYYPRDTVNKINFNYIREAEYLILKGKMNDDSLFLRFKRYDEKKFLLMNRGFHWINEAPFNR